MVHVSVDPAAKFPLVLAFVRVVVPSVQLTEDTPLFRAIAVNVIPDGINSEIVAVEPDAVPPVLVIVKV
jgi:hypothetical protein